ncbi:hypothetical protein PIB30_038568 [Stylosanthes scabra]|uniref:Uncharacterized protein n=1 Tax=Stylosanthes scabra TaxID=79078 RepID=A0ABU6ZCP0_9FABA|nr:hypothetical protein [Stylosanthes scabra]
MSSIPPLGFELGCSHLEGTTYAHSTKPPTIVILIVRFLRFLHQTTLFELIFRLFIDALVRQRSYHPLRLAVTSSKSPATSPETAARAPTRRQKIPVRHLFLLEVDSAAIFLLVFRPILMLWFITAAAAAFLFPLRVQRAPTRRQRPPDAPPEGCLLVTCSFSPDVAVAIGSFNLSASQIQPRVGASRSKPTRFFDLPDPSLRPARPTTRE